MDDDTTRDDVTANEEAPDEELADGEPADIPGEVMDDPPPTKSRFQATRQVFLGGVLLALVVLWVASALDVRLLKSTVAEAAEEDINELRADYNITGSDDDRYRIATILTPTRKYAHFQESYPPDPNAEVLNTLSLDFLFGEPSVKLTVYIQDREFDEHEVEIGGGGFHDPGGVEIVGYDFFYIKKNGAWTFNENSQCSAEDCQTNGTKAFKKLDRKRKQT